jgi:hypothetical protein
MEGAWGLLALAASIPIIIIGMMRDERQMQDDLEREPRRGAFRFNDGEVIDGCCRVVETAARTSLPWMNNCGLVPPKENE